MTAPAIFGIIVLLREHFAVKIFGRANEPTFAVNTDFILRRGGRVLRLAARLQQRDSEHDDEQFNRSVFHRNRPSARFVVIGLCLLSLVILPRKRGLVLATSFKTSCVSSAREGSYRMTMEREWFCRQSCCLSSLLIKLRVAQYARRIAAFYVMTRGARFDIAAREHGMLPAVTADAHKIRRAMRKRQWRIETRILIARMTFRAERLLIVTREAIRLLRAQIKAVQEHVIQLMHVLLHAAVFARRRRAIFRNAARHVPAR